MRRMELKVIIVDDERLALRKMEKLFAEQIEIDGCFDVIGTFVNPYDALELAQRETLHLAFLDIEMPEIDGFELANRLLDIQPQLQIVFTTAYHEYAVKAFELNALDYLLKPVNQSRLTITLQRAAASASRSQEAVKESNNIKLCCLRNLHYTDAYGAEQSFPWKTQRASELFAYLIYHHDKTVNKQTLIDLLWPDHDIERSSTQLHTAIYQIRKIMKEVGLFDFELKYKDGGYSFVLGALKLDVEEWETQVRQAPVVTPDTLEQHLSIMALYRGDFLEEHRYIWAEYEQERIRLVWLNHIKQIAECYSSLEEYAEAIFLYQKIVERLPYVEDGYFGLMKIYAILNHQLEVRKQFQLISSKLQEEFDVTPSKELIEWYQVWLSNM